MSKGRCVCGDSKASHRPHCLRQHPTPCGCKVYRPMNALPVESRNGLAALIDTATQNADGFPMVPVEIRDRIVAALERHWCLQAGERDTRKCPICGEVLPLGAPHHHRTTATVQVEWEAEQDKLKPASPPVSRPEPHDCEAWAAEGMGCMTCNPISQEVQDLARQIQGCKSCESLRSQLAEREQELQRQRCDCELGKCEYHNGYREESLDSIAVIQREWKLANERAERAESTLSALRALLAPIGELEQKATPAKWLTDTRNHTRYIVGPEYNVCSTDDMQKEDAELICALRNLCPALRERLEQT